MERAERLKKMWSMAALYDHGAPAWSYTAIRAALARMTRLDSSSVCERRGCAAADNGRSFVDQPVVFKGLYHKQGVVHAPRQIALEDGITHVPTPGGQALALTLLEVAPTYDRPAGIANKHTPARFYLVIDIHDGNYFPEPAGELLLFFQGLRVHILTVARNMPTAGEYKACAWGGVI